MVGKGLLLGPGLLGCRSGGESHGEQKGQRGEKAGVGGDSAKKTAIGAHLGGGLLPSLTLTRGPFTGLAGRGPGC